MSPYRWPLMHENILRQDLVTIIDFLGVHDYTDAEKQIPKLTNGEQVRAFENEFAAYIGTKYACMVSSGASANLITMAALAHIYGPGDVLVPTITWVSDITSVLQAGLTPRFVDVDPETLGMDWKRAPSGVLAVFLTHCLGFNGLPAEQNTGVHWIEDCCESIGATHEGRKLGTFGLASNFSFYYAHHMTTVEGGMICTSDRTFYETCRMLRGHGLLRECSDADYKQKIGQSFPDLDPQFIFVLPGYNARPTELQAVLGRSQLKRLDANVAARNANLRTFLAALDPDKYRTRYRLEGSSSYAFPLILCEKNALLLGRVLGCLQAEGVEYRRGTSGGGNQLRQPYLRKLYGDLHTQFPQAEHVHDFGLYIGNYPGLAVNQIEALCERLNAL